MCRAHPHVRDRKQRKYDGLVLISHPCASKNPWTSISICFFPSLFLRVLAGMLGVILNARC